MNTMAIITAVFGAVILGWVWESFQAYMEKNNIAAIKRRVAILDREREKVIQWNCMVEEGCSQIQCEAVEKVIDEMFEQGFDGFERGSKFAKFMTRIME